MVATIILAVFAPLLITIFSAIAAVTGVFTAAAISVILSGLALWISAGKNLNNNPCAQMFFQTLATSMITLPVGVTAKVAKQILSLVHLEGAFWGTTVGAASGAKACFAS